MSLRRSLLLPVSLLGLLHAYIGWRVLPDLPVGLEVRIAGGAFLLVSCALMLLGLLARSIRPRALSDRIAAAALFTAGLFSSLLVFTLLRDVVLWAARLPLSAEHLQMLETTSAVLVVGLTVFATVLGFVSARRRARIKRVEVPLRNLPQVLHGFSIAQISDIHVGRTIKRGYVDAIVDAVNALDADLIAVTGDVVDGSVQDLARHTEPLGRLRARHGAFFVTGNHEYYSGEQAWTAEFKRLGLRVLLNEHVVVPHRGAQLVIAGVTDYSSHHFNTTQRSDPAAALVGAPSNAAAKILLAHQPRSAAEAATAGFDLQLSGHTHGGQFWPWTLFVRFQQPFTAGLHRLNNLWVYISRGTGYWGPPNRFGAPSEITLLRLVPEKPPDTLGTLEPVCRAL
jgi:predicted MPP superfamily phosphohydrolase